MTPITTEWSADEAAGIFSCAPRGTLYLPFDAQYLLSHDGLNIGSDSCVKPIPSKEGKMAAECVEFPDVDCPHCREPGHSINDADCKNPVVSIRSEFLGCRKCYDDKYTGLANRYLYDMCRLMGLDFDWLA